MAEDYVHKDTFEETLRRMEALNEASEARVQAQIAASEARHQEYCARQDAQIAEIRADSKRLEETTRIYIENFNQRLDDSLAAFKDSVNSLNNRIDRFINMFSWGAAVLGTIIACVQLYLAFK